MSDETPTIGQKLQEARSEKGLTIDDVQQATKIQRRYLIAIEDGHFEELPGDFYVRAFIKQYAQTVGLDGDELLKDYNDQLPQAAATNVMPVTEEQPTTREPKTTKIGQENTGLDRLRSLLPIIIVSVIVVIILGTIWVFAVRSGRQSSNNSAVSSSHVAVSSSKTESASSHKSSSTSQSSSSSSSSETTKSKTKQTLVPVTTTGANATYRVENAPATNKLAITAKGADSWVQVTPTGGRALYVGTITTGTNKELTLPAGTTGVSVSFGNRTATKVTINGKAVDLTKGTGTTGVLTLQLQAATSAAK